jgi:predicted restriction endonuclease
MQVTKIVNSEISYNDIPKPTNAEMQNEYNFILAEQMTKKLLDKGLISVDEFNKIMAKNRRSFSPYISRIMP